MAKTQVSQRFRRQIKTGGGEYSGQEEMMSVETAESQKSGRTGALGRWLVIVLVGALGVLLLGLIWAIDYVHRFEEIARVPSRQVITQLRQAVAMDPFGEHQRLTYLLLGIDEIGQWRSGSKLTDTMMLLTITTTGRITLISLPRDLWIEELKTKINALYYYGEESEKTTGLELAETVIREITGQKIDGSVVVNLETLVKLIDVVGGLEIEVPKSFTDPQFPKDQDGLKFIDEDNLYETVCFSAGQQHFDGITASKYIRSRHSEDQNEGNDLSRVRRQQQVVAGLAEKLKQVRLWLDPDRVGQLYYLFDQELLTDVDRTQMLGLAYQLSHKQVTLITTQIPVETEAEKGILRHPVATKNSLWIYEPVDPTWNALRLWMNDQLQIE